MEPLTLVERRLHPQIGRARQNPFCERQDAFYVEFFELAGVTDATLVVVVTVYEVSQ